jgi:hypothetical protein
MGYAERSNPNSMWHRNRATAEKTPVVTRASGEPMVVELNLKTVYRFFKELACRLLNILKTPTTTSTPQSPAPIS